MQLWINRMKILYLINTWLTIHQEEINEETKKQGNPIFRKIKLHNISRFDVCHKMSGF